MTAWLEGLLSGNPESFGKWGMVVSEGGEDEVGTRNVAAKVIALRNNFFLWTEIVWCIWPERVSQ